jgi:hypothetical protein
MFTNEIKPDILEGIPPKQFPTLAFEDKFFNLFYISPLLLTISLQPNKHLNTNYI